jgi:hypothetical protein
MRCKMFGKAGAIKISNAALKAFDLGAAQTERKPKHGKRPKQEREEGSLFGD